MTWFLMARRFALLTFIAAVVVAALTATSGARSFGPTAASVTVGVRVDLVSALLLALVGVLGAIVSTYAMTNLRGRRDAGPAGIALLVSIVSLTIMVASANLVTVAAGWTLSGLAFAALVARSGTPRAAQAARLMRRHLVSGDIALWIAIGIGLSVFPSLDRSRLDEIEPGASTVLVAALLLVACVTRTGLVPSHRWLAETAESPSPVSAMLHAGIVNGAGVLVIIAWPLFAAAPSVLVAVLVLGAITVVVGSLAGLVRSDVKGRLACSTSTQMGYMCVQLGLGLPAAALMHLVGHGAYKSWLFLRAGGAIGRNRERPPAIPPAERDARAHLTAVAAVAIAALAASPAITALVSEVGAASLVPVTLALVATAIAGHASGSLIRAAGPARHGVGASAGLVGAAYVWALLGWESLLSGTLRPDPVWGTTAALGLLGLLAVGGVVLTIGRHDLVKRPQSAWATRLLPTALTPTPHLRVDAVRNSRIDAVWHRRAEASWPRWSDADPDATCPAIDAGTVTGAVVTAAATIGPAWPLRAMVAANPLASLESFGFDDAILVAERVHGTRVRSTTEYFLDLHDAGRITRAHLEHALAEEAASHGACPWSTADALVTATRQARDCGQPSAGSAAIARFCDGLATPHDERIGQLVDEHAALWAQRAWPDAGPPIPAIDTAGPWTRWLEAASHRGYDRVLGVRGAAAVARTLPADPAAAIAVMAGSTGLPAARLVGYLAASLASGPGWAGHAAWRARQSEHPAPLIELAAVRMVHDVLLSGAGTVRTPTATAAPEPAVSSSDRIWQRALELGVEHWLVPALGRADQQICETSAHRLTSQSVWCIDVRSEPARRELEQIGHHGTYGFAGFFGASVRYVDPDGISHEQCPALISTGFTAHAAQPPLRVTQIVHRTVTAVSQTPLGALVVAEGGGFASLIAELIASLRPTLARRLSRWWLAEPPAPGAFADPEFTAPSSPIDLDDRVTMAASALLSIGLTEHFAPLLMICGHGSSTENNAFATAYDCGACGGNKGLVNATILVEALNDQPVRDALARQGLVIPVDTVAVAAIHDTTTESVTVGPLPAGWDSHEPLRARLVADLEAATAGSRRQKQDRLPRSRHGVAGRAALQGRAADWSEPTPEWGLAGNAAIVFGPRRLTADLDLGGRVFLHSYDRALDPDGEILEQLLTAPLVVAQWINAQYYVSAVAPELYGAGDKTTHNVVGDVGVLTGAHGDLRSGLPWQALFRTAPGIERTSESLVHEPVRLLAVVAGDPVRVQRIVAAHLGLGQLVTNGWITLMCLDGDHPQRLGADLAWRDWDTAVEQARTPARDGA